MGIFNEFFKKEKPVFTGSRFGFGSGGGGGAAAAGPSVVLSTGGVITQPGNGYAYHHFDGVDIYKSDTYSDTNFSNYSLETRSVGDRVLFYHLDSLFVLFLNQRRKQLM